ncbi:OLC1v1013793C1 [Oldenlandia corymbosa var. corymbosa]|uniref:Dirigent protein n=1 Tax=Oldenlandia corymbosa var. corymbosa TaxID=529605 RepID=A0AAV1E2P8_OLDCO|nr:OLC1v1013793C1 [Oldenlandia corymbosa var. corymbosa]
MKSIMVALLLAIVVMNMASLGHALPDDQSPAAMQKWFQHFPNAVPKLTKLHFFVHNIVNMENPTSVPVAQAESTATSPTNFGLVSVIDAPLTEEPNSKEIIGYVQGIFAPSSNEELSNLLSVNFVFTEGKYKGSTLSVLGRDPVAETYREFPIIGGSGDFRMARGIGTSAASSVNSTTKDDILVEMHFVFYRYVLPGFDSDSEGSR